MISEACNDTCVGPSDQETRKPIGRFHSGGDSASGRYKLTLVSPLRENLFCVNVFVRIDALHSCVGGP